MKSLLFLEDQSKIASVFGIDELKLKEFILGVTYMDSEAQKYVYDVLSKPLKDLSLIERRQKLVYDFCENQIPFDKMYRSFKNFMQLRRDITEKRRRFGNLTRERGVFLFNLKIDRMKNEVDYFIKIYESLNEIEKLFTFNITSPDLQEFIGNIKTINSYMRNFINTVGRDLLASTTEEFNPDVFVEIDHIYDISVSEICGMNKAKPAGFKAADSSASDLVILGVDRMYKKLYNINNSLTTAFLDVSKELQFYNFAIEYYKCFTRYNVECTFPAFVEGPISARHLHDPLLASSLIRQSTDAQIEVIRIVSNNISDLSSCIITGDNNNGKSTFQRSIVFSNLLAQCGLYVPGVSVKFNVNDNFILCFAGWDKEDSFGRFENEVIKTAEAFKYAGPNSIVVFNEIFQSTAYDEATEALESILKALLCEKCKFICVTHLLKLTESFRDYEQVMHIGVTPDHVASVLE